MESSSHRSDERRAGGGEAAEDARCHCGPAVGRSAQVRPGGRHEQDAAEDEPGSPKERIYRTPLQADMFPALDESMLGPRPFPYPYAWIERCVGQVHEEIDKHDYSGDDHHDARHDREVVEVPGLK